jgi:GGDEF domain-containing protein
MAGSEKRRLDEAVASALERLDLTPETRDVWAAALDAVRPALATGEKEPLLAALEDVARNAALTGSSGVEVLLDAVSTGADALHAALEERGDRPALERLEALRREAPLSVSAGFVAGLEETMERLRHEMLASSSLDPVSGALRVTETLDRLALEVERCRRMDLALGVAAISLEEGGGAPACARDMGVGHLRLVADTLRDHLRRYDAVGRTADGDFLIVLPDVSRRGLGAVAERLRHELAEECDPGFSCSFALAHYDYVDLPAPEIVTSVVRRAATVRASGEAVGWI